MAGEHVPNGEGRDGNGGNGDGCESELPAGLRIRGQPQPGRGRPSDAPGWPGVPLPDIPPAELFGRAVRFLRRGRKIILADLAARAGISLGRLSGIEQGKYVRWQRAADPIAQALDFPDAAALLLQFYGRDLPAADPHDLLQERRGGDP